MRDLVKIVALIALFGFAPGSALVGCSNPPSVVQGKVVSYDASKKVLVIQSEATPHPEVTLDLKSAEIGGAPAAGNVVRIAYRDQGGTLVAGRVMNLTTQKKK